MSYDYEDDPRWVNPHERCIREGCRLITADAAMTEVRKTLEQFKDATRMSKALWCDNGDHAFSERDTEAKHFTETVKVDGKDVTTAYDICGKCAVKMKIPAAGARTAITDRPPTFDGD